MYNDERNQSLTLLEKLFLKRKDIKNELRKIEKEIFRYETLCLDTSQGNPVIKSLDFYCSNRAERKKYQIKDSDRIFSKDLPPINERI